MPELIAELLLLFEELKFWKKKKARRVLENNNNLPRKTMIHPVIWFTIIMFIFIAIIRIILVIFYSNIGETRTIDKITEIETVLEQQKRDLGKYPTKLEDVIGINPLRKDINIDAWGNTFYYKQFDNGSRYELKSKGKDGVLNTRDDVFKN